VGGLCIAEQTLCIQGCMMQNGNADLLSNTLSYSVAGIHDHNTAYRGHCQIGSWLAQKDSVDNVGVPAKIDMQARAKKWFPRGMHGMICQATGRRKLQWGTERHSTWAPNKNSKVAQHFCLSPIISNHFSIIQTLPRTFEPPPVVVHLAADSFPTSKTIAQTFDSALFSSENFKCYSIARLAFFSSLVASLSALDAFTPSAHLSNPCISFSVSVPFPSA